MALASSETTPALHIISHIRWLREGEDTFEVSRAELLDTITGLLNRLQADSGAPIKFLLLGGQTVILEDIAAVRPDLLAMLVIYNAGGRLGVGPWYVQVDETLVSGEALVRNLLMARADARRYGLKLMSTAYMPDACGSAGQLPQILRSFGMDTVFLHYDSRMMPLPFRWSAPDGSNVLVINYNDQLSAADAIEQQRASQPDGPFLWMQKANSNITDTLPESRADATQSTLVEYVLALRDSLPDGLRPAVEGELYMQGLCIGGMGRLSARMNLKQTNAHLQTLLTHSAEPFLTLALTYGKLEFPDNYRALLDYGWRMLLKNQSRDTLGGTSLDAVYEEMDTRNRRIQDVTERIVKRALEALPGKRQIAQPAKPLKETFITVWNPNGWPISQVIELDLQLPDNTYPAALKSADGETQMFGWKPASDEASGKISFRASVPCVGYAVYTLELADEEPDSAHLSRTQQGKIIGNSRGETLVVEADRLNWNRANTRLRNILRFVDGGDAGDVTEFRKPKPDVVVAAAIADDIHTEVSPLYERLILRHRMRTAPGLRADGGRDRGVRLLDLTTTATFYENTEGVYFYTQFTNTAHDHRLRAYLRTGILTDRVVSDVAFGLVQRQAAPSPQKRLPTYPMHTVCAVTGEHGGLAMLTRGLPEFEVIREEAQTTLALTLIRAVGWLNKHAKIAAPRAQCQQNVTADFALVPFSESDSAGWLRAGYGFNAPLQAYQYTEKPNTPRQSYLDIDTQHAIMTALKPPQEGHGWIVRLLNPTDEKTEAVLAPHGKITLAHLLNMAEEAQAEFEVVENKIKVRLNPHQLATIRLELEV